MKFLIYHPQPGTEKPKAIELTNYDAAKAEYKRLQTIYPSHALRLVAINDWGERSHIHEGYWN